MIAIAAVVTIVIVAAALFFVLGGDDNKDEGDETHDYWYYVDYGDDATSTITSGWISGDGDDPSAALIQSIGAANCVIDGNWITSINGVEPIYTVTGKSWYTWVWADSEWKTDDTLGLTEPGMTVFYIGITAVGPAPDYTLSFDPNTTDIKGDSHP